MESKLATITLSESALPDLQALGETVHWGIVWELLLGSLKTANLDARVHVSIQRIAELLGIPIQKIITIEGECAEFLHEKVLEKENPNAEKAESSTRNAKLAAGAVIGGGVLFAAGLIAAPLIIPAVVGGAAFVAGAIPLLGIGAAVTAGSSILAVVATPTLPLLFGAAGAGLGSYKAHKLTEGISEFLFVPIPKTKCDEEGLPLQSEEEDISEPWEIDWEYGRVTDKTTGEVIRADDIQIPDIPETELPNDSLFPSVPDTPPPQPPPQNDAWASAVPTRPLPTPNESVPRTTPAYVRGSGPTPTALPPLTIHPTASTAPYNPSYTQPMHPTAPAPAYASVPATPSYASGTSSAPAYMSNTSYAPPVPSYVPATPPSAPGNMPGYLSNLTPNKPLPVPPRSAPPTNNTFDYASIQKKPLPTAPSSVNNPVMSPLGTPPPVNRASKQLSMQQDAIQNTPPTSPGSPSGKRRLDGQSGALSKRASVVLKKTQTTLKSSTGSLKESISSFELLDYKPKKDHSHVGMRVCICVNGWVWNKQEFTTNWVRVREIDPSMECYGLRWESENLKHLGRALVKVLTQSLATQIIKLWIVSISAVAAGLLAAFAWPAAAILIAGLIDNPWTIVATKAKKAGILLGMTLLERAHGRRPVTLIGHSLGARVIFSALKFLEKHGEDGKGIVENVFLLGAACTVKPEPWRKIRSVVAGRLVNAYTKADWVLAFVHRAAGTSLKVAGLGPVMCEGVENVDLSHIVSGHLSYKSNFPKILDYLHISESNYVVPTIHTDSQPDIPVIEDLPNIPMIEYHQ